MILGKKDRQEFERLKQFERDFSDIYWLEMPFLKPFIDYVSRKEMISIETARNRVRREFDIWLKNIENEKQKASSPTLNRSSPFLNKNNNANDALFVPDIHRTPFKNSSDEILTDLSAIQLTSSLNDTLSIYTPTSDSSTSYEGGGGSFSGGGASGSWDNNSSSSDSSSSSFDSSSSSD